MRKHAFFLLLILSLATCVHVQRQPTAKDAAKIKPALTCAQIFELTFGADDLQRIYDTGAKVFAEVRKFESTKYPELIHEFMERAKSPADCETERDVDLWSADIASKIRLFDVRIKSSSDQKTAQAILAKPIFTNAQIATQLACYGECQVRQSQATVTPAVTCEKKCAIDLELAQFYQDSLALKRLMNTCFKGVNAKNSQALRSDFIAQYAAALPPFLEKLKGLQELIRQDLVIDQQIRAGLIKLRDEYAAFKTSRQARTCAPRSYPWTKNLAAAMVNLRYSKSNDIFDGTEGTGFYFNAGSQRYLVTAAHVSTLDFSLGRDVANLILAAGGKKGNVKFEVIPGLSDLGNDVTLTKVPVAGPALAIAGENEIPQLGQRFFISGYPAFGEDKLQMVSCTFAGFGPRLMNGQKNAAYYFRCPGGMDLHGISGGATIDESGKVWGINSSAESFFSGFHSIPLSVTTTGEVKIGIQQIFISDLCYAPGEYEPKRCQIMPNMYEKDIP